MAARYEYTFKRIAVKGKFLGGGFSTAYQSIIQDYALEGWRFVQAYAPATAGYGASTTCDLIFERPLDQPR